MSQSGQAQCKSAEILNARRTLCSFRIYFCFGPSFYLLRGLAEPDVLKDLSEE